MSKSIYDVKLRSVMRPIEGLLRNPKARYLDPDLVLEYFERFAAIRKALKEQYGAALADLPDRALPESSGTTDFEGRGYIKRRYLDQLFDDCRYLIDVLETIEADPMNTLRHLRQTGATIAGNEILISHASKDKPIVKAFVEQILRLGLEVNTSHIFCTSLEGMDIKNGMDFRDQIQAALRSAKIIILIITPNYKASEICQNEMGAAWASGKRVIPLIVEPVTYASVGVLMEPLQIPKIQDPTALSKLRDDITQELGITSTKTDMWDTAKAGFLRDLPARIVEARFPRRRSDTEIEQVELESERLKGQAGLAAKRIADLQAKYDALCLTKGPGPVEDVEAMFDDRAPMEKFNALVKDVREALSPFAQVVRAIIVCDHFKADYEPPVNEYSTELATAFRRKQIRQDDGDLAVNDDNRDVQRLRDTLNRIQQFVSHEGGVGFSRLYEEEYESPLDTNNQEFWEEHFGLRIPE